MQQRGRYSANQVEHQVQPRPQRQQRDEDDHDDHLVDLALLVGNQFINAAELFVAVVIDVDADQF